MNAQFFSRIVQKRPLTAGECRLARSVFGSGLQLDTVNIVACAWVWRRYAISPNGHIYFHPDDWRVDFSLGSLSIQGWLIHELTHVWQVQQGMAVLRRALFDRRYAYALQQNRDFFSYGIEQQAQMVQDYFMRREQGLDCAAWQACLPFK